MDLKSLTIDAARSAVQERKTTALALAEAHYARIKQEDGQIGAFLTLSKERALEQADRMDRMAAEGKILPPLGGVPVGIKDVMSTRGVRTTAGSKILEKYIPPYDCTAVARMEAAGARLTRWIQVLLEFQRDWTRHETYEAARAIVEANGGGYGMGLAYARDMIHPAS